MIVFVGCTWYMYYFTSAESYSLQYTFIIIRANRKKQYSRIHKIYKRNFCKLAYVAKSIYNFQPSVSYTCNLKILFDYNGILDIPLTFLTLTNSDIFPTKKQGFIKRDNQLTICQVYLPRIYLSLFRIHIQILFNDCEIHDDTSFTSEGDQPHLQFRTSGFGSMLSCP